MNFSDRIRDFLFGRKVTLVAIALISCFFLLFIVKLYLKTPTLGKDQGFYELEIQPGDTISGVATRLKKDGLIKSADQFRWIYSLFYSEKILKAGHYELQFPVSYEKLFSILHKGREKLVKITVPEGLNYREIIENLKKSPIKNSKNYQEANSKALELLHRSGFTEAYTVEGFLFPDTYLFSEGESEEKILETMVKNFLSKLPENFGGKARAVGLSPYQVIILASIVEKETGAVSERGFIASVLINRLRRGMRLQSDPTVIYGLQNFDGNIRKKHLRQKTSHNTYVIRGLPPTPIANPGIDSIRAVLNPPQTSYLYFVAKGNGTSYFSKTLKEHNRAVRKYQLGENPEYHSAPKKFRQ